jgi:hypothetical protein
LNYDFIVPILSECYDIPQVLGFTCSYHLIKEPITLALHVVPIYPLRNFHVFVLGNDDVRIEVLLECRVKYIVNARLFLNKPWVFFPLFFYQICFAHIAVVLPPIQILGQPKNWSSHVYVGGRVDLLYIKSFFLLLTTITIIFLLNLLIPRCPTATSTC